MRNRFSVGAWCVMLINIMVLLVLPTESMVLCFGKHPKKLAVNHNIHNNETFAHELRSYHPHYLNSYSYGEPLTPHIYYGEVINNKPIFLFKDIDSSTKQCDSLFIVDGLAMTDASAKTYLLRREQLKVNRFMFVLQMENSFLYDLPSTISLLKKEEYFLFICQYQQKTKAFMLMLIYNEQKLLNLNNDKHMMGISLNIRNQSLASTRLNWQLSQTLQWKGIPNVEYPENIYYRGVIIEIQYSDDLKQLKDVKIHLQEITVQEAETKDDFINRVALLDLNHFLKIQKVKINQNCANAATEKLLDGLSYQYGTLQIKNGSQTVPNDPTALLSFSPSRKRFPWGFLWDDGFHCQVAVRNDTKLVFSVIKSWLDTQLQNGWIPRQQNRGAERQHLCNCPPFMIKDIRDGNPPTLVFALDYLLRKNKINKDTFPLGYWLKLKKWYNWFITTQKDEHSFIFRWHDSINNGGASFNSGMDDFPRPLNTKGHIDLQAWMYLFTQFMTKVSLIYGENNNIYVQNLQQILTAMSYFLEPTTNLYRDLANDTTFSQQFGYPNILPLAFGMLQYNSKEYNATMDKIKSELDTNYGLSSISMKSPHYLQASAYWRGPVWININYVFLRGLKLYYPLETEFYDKLRSDLISTVCGNWQKSGYFYENYIKGSGSYSYPFNGWTSLIAIITHQSY